MCCSPLSMMFAQIRSIIIMHGIFVYHEDNSFAGINPLSEFREIQPLCSNSESKAEFHLDIAWSFCEPFHIYTRFRPWTDPSHSPSRISKILVVFVTATDLAAAATKATYLAPGGRYSRVTVQISERREIEADQSSWKVQRFKFKLETWAVPACTVLVSKRR